MAARTHHISQQEEKKWGGYSIQQRKYMYARKILLKNSNLGFKKVNSIVKWKFNSGGISPQWYSKLKEALQYENTH
jgi:hypothetical protein